MKGSKLTYKFWARAVGLVLFAVLSAVFVLCAAGAVYCDQRGWHSFEAEFELEGFNAFLFFNRYNFIIVGVIAGGCMLALFIFLLCSAARRDGEEGFVLIGQDNIPFDIYLVLAGLLCIGALVIGLNITATSTGYALELALAAFCIAVAAGVAMAACMTLAARIKTRTLFKNTIIYRIFAWLGRLFNMMGMNLKAAFIFLGYLLLNAIGAVYLFNSRYEGFALVMLAFFNCAVLYGILECVSQMKKLKEAAGALAEGDLSYETDTSKLKWEFKEHGESLNSVGRGMARAVNERMRSERFKTELITNVSHDLKTPLTSIVTYIDLLQKEEIPGEQAKEYVDTIARQSAKLKKLTEDLIEASKASSGVMSVNLERVNVSELLRQSVAEYGDRMAAAGIATVMTLPEDDIYITADGRLLWRVMDNLLLNICRHGMNGTRAYIGAEKREENTVISFKNISSKELNISPEELLERFVQGDESRSTEGSGLGLSIAQSLTELMKGKMQLYLDGDLFKVELIFSKDEM